ncbi:MAG: TSUP family transporter [Bacteroidetes bacterium]|nr:TSUP family transporter [Bacteroidota bacterium]
MDYVLIALVTVTGAAATLVSGFGLGTLLMPVFGLFFPVETAIAMTAIVHLSNNLIKLAFYRRFADRDVLIRFGIPSILAAITGAFLLNLLTVLSPVAFWSAAGHTFSILPVKLVIAILLAGFSLLELIPALSNLQFDRKFLPVGGLLSGFFGGLSGNQGALRSAFLVRAGLSKEAFIGTGVSIACLIDISRLTVYSGSLPNQISWSEFPVLALAVFSAFIGVVIGNRLIKKITIRTVQLIVSVFLLVFSLLLGLGII